jgi:ATP-binding cassette, subfamily B, bacterial PglK
MKTLKQLFYLLKVQERKKGLILLIIITIMALLDMIGVASIMPFMAVLTNPDLIDSNIILNTAFEASNIFGVKTVLQFQFLLGILVFIFLIFSITFKAFTMYLQTYFAENIDYSIAKRLVEGYLHQPYGWFLNRNSAELGKSILSEVNAVISNAFKPLMDLIGKSLSTIAILILLILIDPKLAFIVGFTLILSYGVIFLFTRNFLKRIGLDRFKANSLRYNVVAEAFGAIKEIKIGGLENTYVERFSKPAKVIANRSAAMTLASQIPRLALEAIAFGGLLLTVLYLMLKSGNINNAVPMIALYAFAGYRLMPALQQIYNAIARIRFVTPALDALCNDMNSLQPINLNNNNKDDLIFKKSITLSQVHYHYPNAPKMVLKDINLNIPARSTVALVGTTGSGKTTTVDILLGLLEAQQGNLKVDGRVINKHNLRTWQNSIGYVPQQIYLADDTVSANIAFGKNPEDIDQQAVERAAKIAELHEFVINDLPLKYQTEVGERGVRLSGGQRQRIGIARALYHKPQLLILDEATNALDNLTEEIVMKAVNNLSKDITIIIIAHRLSTVKECDNIFFLEKGELKAQGNFNELVKTNENFSLMTNNH